MLPPSSSTRGGKSGAHHRRTMTLKHRQIMWLRKMFWGGVLFAIAGTIVYHNLQGWAVPDGSTITTVTTVTTAASILDNLPPYSLFTTTSSHHHGEDDASSDDENNEHVATEVHAMRHHMPPDDSIPRTPPSNMYQSHPATLPYRRLMLVHLGKAGGSTVASTFGLYRCNDDMLRLSNLRRLDMRERMRYKCLTMHNKSTTKIARVMVDQCHSADCLSKMHRLSYMPHLVDAYLFVLRHPLDRILSWYHYVHPLNCHNTNSTRITSRRCAAAKEVRLYPFSGTAKFYKCHPDFGRVLRNVGKILHRHHFADVGTDCASLLHHVLVRGVGMEEPMNDHVFFNNRYYVNQTMHQIQLPVLALRTETLWPDLVSLDLQLGGHGHFEQWANYKENYGSDNFPTKQSEPHGIMTYPVNARRALCCLLRDELDAFHEVLVAAQNLPSTDKDQTWQAAVERCGFASTDELDRACLALQR